MALELLSALCTFDNSTKCPEITFDPHSFSEKLKGLLQSNEFLRPMSQNVQMQTSVALDFW